MERSDEFRQPFYFFFPMIRATLKAMGFSPGREVVVQPESPRERSLTWRTLRDSRFSRSILSPKSHRSSGKEEVIPSVIHASHLNQEREILAEEIQEMAVLLLSSSRARSAAPLDTRENAREVRSPIVRMAASQEEDCCLRGAVEGSGSVREKPAIADVLHPGGAKTQVMKREHHRWRGIRQEVKAAGSSGPAEMIASGTNSVMHDVGLDVHQRTPQVDWRSTWSGSPPPRPKASLEGTCPPECSGCTWGSVETKGCRKVNPVWTAAPEIPDMGNEMVSCSQSETGKASPRSLAEVAGELCAVREKQHLRLLTCVEACIAQHGNVPPSGGLSCTRSFVHGLSENEAAYLQENTTLRRRILQLEHLLRFKMRPLADKCKVSNPMESFVPCERRAGSPPEAIRSPIRGMEASSTEIPNLPWVWTPTAAGGRVLILD
ncbi:MAG: hypothetical protein SGPRY_012863 [Prymnesium sp.]